MKIYIGKREAVILDMALLNLRHNYPNTYGPEAEELQNKLYACIQLQKSGKGCELVEKEALKEAIKPLTKEAIKPFTKERQGLRAVEKEGVKNGK